MRSRKLTATIAAKVLKTVTPRKRLLEPVSWRSVGIAGEDVGSARTVSVGAVDGQRHKRRCRLVCMRSQGRVEFVYVANCGIQFGFDIAGGRREILEIKPAAIKQVRRHDVAERCEHRTADVRDGFFKLGNQPLDLYALQVG